jgi:hypothetical protein
MHLRYTLALLACLAVAPAAAEPTLESLPDRVEHTEIKPEQLSERFSAQPLDNESMESMYLESPNLAKDNESDALSALSDKDRYLQNDPLFQEQLRNSQDTIIGLPGEPQPTTPPPILDTLTDMFNNMREL